jgi:hypothetical protein
LLLYSSHLSLGVPNGPVIYFINLAPSAGYPSWPARLRAHQAVKASSFMQDEESKDPCVCACMHIWAKMDQLTSKPRSICPELAASTRHQADLLRDITQSPCTSTSTLASTHLRLVLVIDRIGSSSPTSTGVSAPSMCHTFDIGSRTHHTMTVVIIADNHLHHQHCSIITAIIDRGQRQRQQDLLLLLLATPRRKSRFNPWQLLPLQFDRHQPLYHRLRPP